MNTEAKPTARNRYQHRQNVIVFLQRHLSDRHWELTLPSSGHGHETYIAQSDSASYFVKLGAHIARYQVMASLGLTPATIESGYLEDGVSILVQPHIKGWRPTWQDFRHYLPKIARVVNKMHHSPALRAALPTNTFETHKDAGLAAFKRIQHKWKVHRAQVPGVANEVDEALIQLQQEIQGFTSGGLVSSHNDICNSNWLITSDESVYVVDLEAMTLDDPAQDMGALLWWYYPPESRAEFLKLAGHPYDEGFRNRMRVRMALHCLNILLPRTESFDKFDATSFGSELTDFRAIVAGEENPRGYND